MKNLVEQDVQDGSLIKAPARGLIKGVDDNVIGYVGGRIEFLPNNVFGTVRYKGLDRNGIWHDIVSAYPHPGPDPDDLFVVEEEARRRSNEQ